MRCYPVGLPLPMKITLYLFLSIACASCTTATPASIQVPTQNAFDLQIQLNDIYNPDTTVTALVRIGQAFMVRSGNGKIMNSFWGELHEQRDGIYPLDLSISEWESKASNLSGTASYRMKLDESQSEGFVSGFVYSRTITLRRHGPPT
jgi:hypothetical protein